MTSIDTDHFFPPRRLSDLVVHYEGHSFHVHRERLHTHSLYFRAIIDDLKGRSEECPNPSEHEGTPCIVCAPITTKEGKILTSHVRMLFEHIYFPRLASTLPYDSKERSEFAKCTDEESQEPWMRPCLPIDSGLETYVSLSPKGSKEVLGKAVSLMDYWRCKFLLTRSGEFMIFMAKVPTQHVSSLCLHYVLARNCGMDRNVCDQILWAIADKGAPLGNNRWTKEFTLEDWKALALVAVNRPRRGRDSDSDESSDEMDD